MLCRSFRFVIWLVVATVLYGCSAGIAGQETAIWYLLQDGSLRKSDRPSAKKTSNFLPWTVQQRVTDIAQLDGEIFLGLNGFGLVQMELGELPVFRYFHRPDIFRNRTITRLVPLKSAILCHYYFNTVLNTVDRPSPVEQTANLLLIDPFGESQRAKLLSPPSQSGSSRWELISLIPDELDGTFNLEWKASGAQSTDFRYSSYDIQTNRERIISRAEFRQAYGSVVSEEPPEFAELVHAIRAVQPDRKSLQLAVRSSSSPSITRFYLTHANSSKPEPSQSVLVRVYRDNGVSHALLEDGTVIRLGSGDSELIELPQLEESFMYTDLFVNNDTLILPWEEVDFTHVGQAGLLLLKM